MIWIWIRRFFFSKRRIKFKVLLSLSSLILGVASLTITMIVMSSYQTTLKKTLVDSTGHLVLVKRVEDSPKNILNKILPLLKGETYHSAFISKEVLALSKSGQLSGVLLQGLDQNSIDRVLLLKSKIIKGAFFKKHNEVIIGMGLAHRLDLKVGSSLSVVVPKLGSKSSERSRPVVKKFQVSGIVDLGRYDFNSRYISIPLSSAQSLLGFTNQVQGFRFRFHDDKHSHVNIEQISQQLGPGYIVRDWRSMNQNLFAAIQMEKVIIFIILLILIVAAAFNISNQFFIDVLRRFRDIGIMKSMGATPSFIIRIFSVECLIISVTGTLLGLLLGVGLVYGLFSYFDFWKMLIPADVYKLNQIIVEIQPFDLLMIFVSSIVICLLSFLIPIKKILKLSPKEGLDYE